MTDLTLSGAAAGQTTTDAAALSPFAAVSVTSGASATPYVTATVALSTTADGALSDLGIGVLSADGSIYTVKGSPADVQAALRDLVFTPVQHEVPVGQAVTTGFTLTASDAAGAVTDARTTVVSTAANTLPVVTDTSAVQAPTSSNGTVGGATGLGATSFTPFAYTTITDPDAGATEATTIALSQDGAATDAIGVLSGAGLTKTGVGTYAVAAGTPSAETAALMALRFTPANPGMAASLDVAITVSDGFGVPVATASTLGLAASAIGSTVVSASTETVPNNVDTPVSNASHSYATVIEAVLNGSTVVYDQSFNLPYSDPQVQAAVTQAQAALRNGGASSSAPMLAASSLYTQSQTSTVETGRMYNGGTQVTNSDYFGGTFVGPHTTVGLAVPSGYFYVAPGQLDLNVNSVLEQNIYRTVTTTSTDLLSQQYLITGTSMAAAAPTTTALVSSSAAGVEGNMASYINTITGGITDDGASVLFSGTSTNLTPADTNAITDLYLKNTSTGALTLITTNVAGVRPNADVFYGSIDGDGNLAAFTTTATNLDARAADGNSHLYVRNVAAGTLTLVAPSDYVITSVSTGAAEPAGDFVNLVAPSISGDGRYVAVQGNDGAGATAQILVFDTATHTAKDLSGLDAIASHAVVSEDGSTVVFNSNAAPEAPPAAAPLLVGAADTSAVPSFATPHATAAAVREVYAYSMATESFQLVSDTQGVNTLPVAANGDSVFAAVSNNGAVVVFQSAANNLDDRDTDTGFDVYAKDMTTGRLYLVDTTADGSTKANAAATNPVVSGDGTMVAFTSAATNLVAGVTDGLAHIYVKTLATDAISVVDETAAGALGDKAASTALFSPDSNHIAFSSSADNLVGNDANGVQDVFYTGVTAAAAPPLTAPAITGVVSPELDPGGATLKPFATATATDTNAGATITVQLQSVAVVNGQPQNTGTGGAFAGGGFGMAEGTESFTSTSIAAVQAALQAVSFTPSTADARIIYTISDSTGSKSVASVDVLSTPATPTNTTPVIGGTAANQPTTDKATLQPFATATITDPDAAQTETVTVTYAAANGTLAGAGFTGSGGTLTGSFTGAGAGQAAAAAQAALEALVFTPTANEVVPPTTVTTGFGLSVSDGAATATNAGASVVATSVNDPPVIGGTTAGQADTAGAPINPFATATVADPDTGQPTTVTVSFAAGAGTLSGGGFVQTAPGVYSVTEAAGGAGASAAAAQADLRAAVFTPTAGQSATTTLTVAVSDGQATATSSGASVTATFTAPAPGGGGGGGSQPGSVVPAVDPLPIEFQNLERALLTGVDALTPGTPVNAAVQAFQLLDSQYVHSTIGLAQAEAQLLHMVDGATAVAVADYAFFTGFTPTAQGLDYLVHSAANATDLNDPYYARFSTENRYINFAVNLATGPGAGAAAFAADYGSLSLADATSKAYLAVFGTAADATKVAALLNTLVPDGLGGQETRSAYFAQYGGDGPNGQGAKAAMIGFLLANAVETGAGVYGASTEHYLAAIAHGQAPAFGSELALTYGPTVNLVGSTPIPDPTVTG